MLRLSFDVNDSVTRRTFLQETLMEAIGNLADDSPALWGKMTPQHMVDHLVWSFELSTGRAEIHREIPASVSERAKKFLYDNRPSPRMFKNPVLAEDPPSLRFVSLEESTTVLGQERDEFFHQRLVCPNTFHNHPIFGPLSLEEWERTHYKHCFHHLLQFDLIVDDPK